MNQFTRKTRRIIGGVSRKLLYHPGEALLSCRMAFWVGVLSISSRLFSLPRALQMVATPERSLRAVDSDQIQQRLARSIDQLLSIEVLIFKPICWKRAAILHRYLALHGMTSKIVFGVRNESEGNVTGHAWLENDAGPILESTPPDYVVTYRFPSDKPYKTELAVLSSD
jgi:transglutaminase superfamily protein